MPNDGVYVYGMPDQLIHPDCQPAIDWRVFQREVKITLRKGDQSMDVEVPTPVTYEDMEWLRGLFELIGGTPVEAK